MADYAFLRDCWHRLSGFGRSTGFFTPYLYQGAVADVIPPYPEFDHYFTRYLEEMRLFAAAIRRQDDQFKASLALSEGPDWGSSWLTPLDCATIYTAVAHFRPARIIEIGSGNSTHFLAQAVKDHHLDTRLTCIDPEPRIAISGLELGFERRALREDDCDLTDSLGANDILFVDSSHLLQEGYDLDIIFNRIVPRLQQGVIVHVHDIFLPDPYPVAWKGRHYNEQNMLGGWLLSGAFEAVFASHFVHTRHSAMLAGLSGAIPEISTTDGGSLWLKKALPPARGATF